MSSPELEKSTNNYHFGFVHAVVTDSLGNRVEFDADSFKFECVRHYIDDRPVSTEWNPSFKRVKSTPVTVSTPEAPVDIPAPKYVPAMGDAAQAYCDEINAAGECTKFRWNEVWRRMWAARSKEVGN